VAGSSDAPLLRAGRIGRPHGLDGSFYVTQPRSALLETGRTVLLAGAPREIVRRAGTDARPIVRLAGCANRAGAEALRGGELLVPREEAPALGEEEWWPEELEGCTVHDGTREIGVVRALRALPSCEVLEVARPGEAGGELLVPLVHDAVRSVDVGRRRIEIDLGFLGEDGPSPPDAAA